MKSLVAVILLLVAVAFAAPNAPQQFEKVNYDYIISAGLPMVGFQVPSFETNELTFTGQSSFLLPDQGMSFLTPVGCTNVTDFWWKTKQNQVYKLMMLESNQWVYTKIKIIGDGNEFHYYDFSNFSNKFHLQ